MHVLKKKLINLFKKLILSPIIKLTVLTIATNGKLVSRGDNGTRVHVRTEDNSFRIGHRHLCIFSNEP